MPSFVSPGVYVIEKDISDYTPTINPSVVGVVGFADKGIPNKATLITSQEQLVREFGRPSEYLPGQGIEGALEMLETTNSLWYVRAMDSLSARHAGAAIPVAASPGIFVAPGPTGGYGVTDPLYLRIQVYIGVEPQFPGEYRSFAIPAGTASPLGGQAQALRNALGGSLTADKIGVYWDPDSEPDSITGKDNGLIACAWAGADITIDIEGFTDENYTVPVPAGTFHELSEGGGLFAGLIDESTPVPSNGLNESLTARGYVFDSDTFHYGVQSRWPGQGYNQGAQPDGQVVGNAIQTLAQGAGSESVFSVYQDGSVAENFVVSFGPGSFIEDVINTGSAANTSELIMGKLFQEWVVGEGVIAFDAEPIQYWQQIVDIGVALGETLKGVGGSMEEPGQVNPRFCKLRDKGVGLAGGNSGLENPINALVGSSAESPKTGIHALDYEVIPVTIAAVPGISDQQVQNELVTLAEATTDFLAVLGTPIGVGSPQAAIDWHNGMSDSRTVSLNSSYAALYFPHVKVFNPYYGKDIFLDPAVFGVRQMCYTDMVSESWFAPAGFSRGRLTKPIEVQMNLNQGDRDSLYSGGNAINPIVNFPQQGITIFGQRTLQRMPTALDRINVRRLLLAIKHVILASTRRFVFEPNDEITWEKVKNLLDPMMDDIRRRRGITQFKVICDETTNTPVRVDRNELWCKVLIKPTKTAEVIVFELNITNQTTNLSS